MIRNRTRREFLKDSAVASAAAAAWGGLAPARVLGANDRVRVGVLGAGGRARGLMRNFLNVPGVEIVAVCDVYQPATDEAIKIAGAAAQSTFDYREVLDRQDVDAVLIGSPDHWHKDMLVDSIRAGKDVYLEKPIMHTIEEGVEMVRAVEESKCVVQTGTQQRSWDHYILGKQIVDSGKLGRITYIHTYWYQNYGRWGRPGPVDTSKLDWKRWLGKAPDQPFSVEKFRWWRHYWDFGGGILADLLTHWMDVIQWYMGQTLPRSVNTVANRYLYEWEAPDAITAVFEFPGEFMVTFTGGYGHSVDDGGITFRGTQATLKIDRARLAVYSEGAPYAPGQLMPEPEIVARSEHDGTAEHVRNFVECVRSRKTPTAPIRAGFEAARTSMLGNLAMKRGQKITVDPSTGSVS
jgi:predicted dehydrogenase